MSTEGKRRRTFRWQGDKRIYSTRISLGTVPVFVREAIEDGTQDKVWFVWPAMEMALPVAHALEARLRTHADEGLESYWLFCKRSTLSAITELHDGATPEYVYRVPSYPKTVHDEYHTSADSELLRADITEEFMNLVAERTAITDAATMKLIWNAVCQTMVHWLLKHRKPLNFGLFTLCAIPYRANWKSVLYAAFPRSHYCFAGNENEVYDRVNAMGIADAFMGTEVLEMNSKDHWAGWTLELIPNKLWEDAVRRTETFRWQETGPEEYAKHIASTIKRLRPFLIAAYRSFVCRSVKAAARIRRLGGRGCQILVPNTPRGGIRPRLHHGREGDIVFRSSVDWEKPEFKQLLNEKIDEMSVVSGVQQTTSQLRIAGGHVDEPDHEPY